MNENQLFKGLFSKTRQAVLALLYGRSDSSFYTKQILDAIKIGRGSVQRELKNLTAAGIISREVEGRQVYYRANDKCPIFNELKNIVRKTFGIADVISQSLTPVTNKVQVAFIFGSIARSMDVRRSDIDLMIIGKISFDSISSLLQEAEDKLSREINPVVYQIAEFKQKTIDDHYFVKNVLESEKIFLIGDEGELAGLVK